MHLFQYVIQPVTAHTLVWKTNDMVNLHVNVRRCSRMEFRILAFQSVCFHAQEFYYLHTDATLEQEDREKLVL